MPRRRVTRASLRAAIAAHDAYLSDADQRLPILRGTVGTVAHERSELARKRTRMVKGGAIDGTVRLRQEDGTVLILPPAIDRDRRKPSDHTPDRVNPPAGRIGTHPVTGAPVAQHGVPMTVGLGDYEPDEPDDLHSVDAAFRDLPRTPGNSTARTRTRTT